MTVHPWEYLDDLIVGQEFESDTVRVEREATLAFVQEFDPQPFHFNPEAASLSLFGRLAASGWITAALTMKLLVASVPLANGIIGLSIGLSWPTPTYPDDVLHLIGTVQAIEPSASKPDRGVVTLLMGNA
ncbi:MaoC/PaaZ C-terminal domain-containing protein [Pseudomonas sp. BF-RE-26]|uniref:MaoC/PaaZ C-terminal domain-containing protein n=1 Tax=Pseudomonas sp. BF-RE-26 TaxID=2832396 RepID=UPI001CBE20F8|nr:MaoC/PaaZ C-terminal domain-containing protein [Pseudomonas sp. BF-RE-26]